MNSVLIGKLKRIVGAEWVTARKEDILDYVMDETAPVVCPKPAADVVLVRSHRAGYGSFFGENG
jgi:hypothetical protein